MNESNQYINLARSNSDDLRFIASMRYERRPSFLKGLSKNEFESVKFLSVKSAFNLIKLLRESTCRELEEYMNTPRYRMYKIQKRKGGQREITVPDQFLKHTQRSLNYFLQHYYSLIGAPEVFGFVKSAQNAPIKSSIAANAAVHVGQYVVMNLDIKDFFNSISGRQIFKLFKSNHFQFNNEIATALTLLCTYQGKLPTGAPTSPILSNFICLELDAELKDFASQHHLKYSRYADDLTFSSNQFITDEMKLALRSILEKHNFKINENKWRIRTKNQQQLVTGIVVNEKINVNRKFIKHVRAMLHDLEKSGLQIATSNHFKTSATNAIHSTEFFLNRLKGYVDFIGQVRGTEDLIYLGMKGKLEVAI